MQACTQRCTIRRGFQPSALRFSSQVQPLSIVLRTTFQMNRVTRSGHPESVGTDGVFLTAEWQHLAMLNYEVDAGLLLPFVPAGTELDRWNGKVFVSLVGFRFLKTKLFGLLPIPMHSNFDEVNLRFYVRRLAGREVRRGVVFIHEVVPRRAIAFIARSFYNENYVALAVEDIAAVLCRKPESAFLAEGSAVTVMRGRRL